MDRMEKAILNALEKSKQTEPVEKAKAPTGPEERHQCYEPPMEMDYQLQANAMGNWNPGGHWNQNGDWVPKQRDAPWMDHPNFRWTEPNSNPPPQRPPMRIHRKRDPNGPAEIMMGRTTGATGARVINQTGQAKISRISIFPIINEESQEIKSNIKEIKVPGIISAPIKGQAGIIIRTKDQEGISTILKGVVLVTTAIKCSRGISITTKVLVSITRSRIKSKATE
ncbi:hypothetical protein AAHA92_22460 [Salvia divinorum]|uniref:Uncharacterized protein n=1 Tax=Salvia divinorum TaxID=28513 RepID=A0ABD1GNR6_SALDI